MSLEKGSPLNKWSEKKLALLNATMERSRVELAPDAKSGQTWLYTDGKLFEYSRNKWNFIHEKEVVSQKMLWLEAGRASREAVKKEIELLPFSFRSLYSTKKINVRYDLDDFGLVERFLFYFGGELIFVPELDQWYVWGHQGWEKALDADVRWSISIIIKGLLETEASFDMEKGGYAKLLAFVSKCKTIKKIDDILKLLKIDPRIRIIYKKTNPPNLLLGADGVVLDVKTGAIIENKKNYYILAKTKAKIGGDTSELFYRVVLDAMSNSPKQAQYIQKLAGYMLTGNPKLQSLFIAHGFGANGKSTIFNAIMRAMGEYAGVFSAATFAVGKNGEARGAPRPDLVALAGKRLVLVTEFEDGLALNQSLVKSLTGGDEITARGLYSKEYITFKPACTIVMPTNHKPQINSDDAAIWRRVRLIPFKRNFEKEGKMDVNLQAKLDGDLDAVMAWMVEGLRLYNEFGLDDMEDFKAAKQAYREEEDEVGAWMEERTEAREGTKTAVQKLYLSFKQWTEDRGDRYCPSLRTFAKRLADKGFERVKIGNKGERGFAGLGIAASQ